MNRRLSEYFSYPNRPIFPQWIFVAPKMNNLFTSPFRRARFYVSTNAYVLLKVVTPKKAKINVVLREVMTTVSLIINIVSAD